MMLTVQTSLHVGVAAFMGESKGLQCLVCVPVAGKKVAEAEDRFAEENHLKWLVCSWEEWSESSLLLTSDGGGCSAGLVRS